MPSIRRLAQHGAAIAFASFLVVASSKTAADTPTSEEVAKRWKKRAPLGPAEIRQRFLDQRGVQPTAGPGSPRWQAVADGRGGTGLGPAGFHAGGLGVPELTPQNPLFDPLGLFGDETGEQDPIGGVARLFLADFDGDGDLDAFVGDKYGYVRYLENVGTAADPVYEERTGAASPTGGLDLSETGDGGVPFGPSAPTLIDIDGDGDLDLFVGQGDGDGGANGRVLFFENDGAGNLARNDADNPLDGFVFGQAGATPHFADIDADGDFDAFVGTKLAIVGDPPVGEVYYLENDGDADNPLFVDQTDVVGVDPFAGVVFNPLTAPFFADIDGDGDSDAFVGEYYNVRFFENQSPTPEDPTTPVLVEQTGADHPLGSQLCLAGGPSLGDVDGDGDLDAFVTGGYFKLGIGSVQYFENTGHGGEPAFLAPGDRLELVDVDRDGDLDAVMSYFTFDPMTESGGLEVRYFENTGTATMPVWTLRSGPDNPFFTFNTGYAFSGSGYSYFPATAPTVGDFDRDGVLEAFVGLPDGTLEFLKDDGTGQLLPTATHPLEGLDFGADADPQLVDVDGDGELDLVVGHNRYDAVEESYVPTVTFFLNVPGLAEDIDTTPELVVDLSDAGISSPAPALADIDGDGDLDLYVGGYGYDAPALYPLTLLLENTAGAPGGLAFDPNAAELVEAFVHPPNAPALGDVNGDGVLDLAIGNGCGVEFFLSEVAGVEVTKSVVDGTLAPGGTVEYEITLENVGTVTIQDLAGPELTDTLPAELALTAATVTSGPGSVTVDLGTNAVSYDGTIPPGGVVTISVSADIAEGTEGDTVSNQAFANFDSDGDATADAMEPSDDPLTAPDDDPTLFVVSGASLEVTKVISGGELEAGGTVEYTVTIDNVGTDDLPDDPANPELTDTLSAGLTLVAAMVTSGPGAVTIDPGTNTVRYDGSISSGETVEIVIEATIDAGTEGDVIDNQAVAFFDTDGDGTNDAEEPSDDPATAADNDGTSFVVDSGLSVLEIPTLSQWGAMLFGALLSLAGWLGIRRMG